jgi:hypothetical protein
MEERAFPLLRACMNTELSGSDDSLRWKIAAVRASGAAVYVRALNVIPFALLHNLNITGAARTRDPADAA